MWNAPHLADMDLIDAEGNTAQAYDPREAQSTERKCLNCHGTGTRSWPQSRQTDPRRPFERERLDPQVTKCGPCSGTGVIAV